MSRDPISMAADKQAAVMIAESEKEGFSSRLIWSNMFNDNVNNFCHIWIFRFTIAHKPTK